MLDKVTYDLMSHCVSTLNKYIYTTILTFHRNKRLGCVKSTMFNIGGVTALKQHSFFEFIDWNALERLEVDPPFNFI